MLQTTEMQREQLGQRAISSPSLRSSLVIWNRSPHGHGYVYDCNSSFHSMSSISTSSYDIVLCLVRVFVGKKPKTNQEGVFEVIRDNDYDSTQRTDSYHHCMVLLRWKEVLVCTPSQFLNYYKFINLVISIIYSLSLIQKVLVKLMDFFLYTRKEKQHRKIAKVLI